MSTVIARDITGWSLIRDEGPGQEVTFLAGPYPTRRKAREARMVLKAYGPVAGRYINRKNWESARRRATS